MKKICNLATAHPMNDTRIFRKECFIEMRRYEVHYITCDRQKNEFKNNIHVYGVKKFKSRLLRAIFAPFLVYRRAKAVDADIYVLHDPELLLIALLLKKRGKYVIWDCHEYYDLEIQRAERLPFFVKKIVLFSFRCTLRLVVPHLNGCMTISDEMAQTFKKLRARNIHLLYNYAMLSEFKNLRPHDFNHAQYILFTGTLYPIILNLFHALPLCRNNVKCIVCFRNKMPINHDLTDFSRVEFKENVTLEEIKLLAGKCFAGIVLNWNVFLPASTNKRYEYMAEFLPTIDIVTQKTSWLEDLVHNNGHPLGLTVDANPKAIADAIDMLYENKELARTMGENGRRAFETKYNFESQADGFLKFLEDVSQTEKSEQKA